LRRRRWHSDRIFSGVGRFAFFSLRLRCALTSGGTCIVEERRKRKKAILYIVALALQKSLCPTRGFQRVCCTRLRPSPGLHSVLPEQIANEFFRRYLNLATKVIESSDEGNQHRPYLVLDYATETIWPLIRLIVVRSYNARQKASKSTSCWRIQRLGKLWR